MVEVEEFLKKHLIDFTKTTPGCYCFGKYTDSIKTLVEGFLAVSAGSFVRVSSHVKGHSKRLKSGGTSKSTIYFQQTNSIVPIVYSGYPFEVIHTERWICNETSPSTKKLSEGTTTRKRKVEQPACTASIQIRTARVYNEFSLLMDEETSNVSLRKAKDEAKGNLLKAIHAGETVKYTDIHYCRFPLKASHNNHDVVSRSNSTQLDKRVIKKMRDLVKNGIYDIPSVQSMVTDFVLNTIFAHAEENEKPKLGNRRFFPSVKAIRNHVFLAVGKLENIPGYCSQKDTTQCDSPPSVTNIVEISHSSNKVIDSTEKRRMDVGFIAIHAGAGFHSNERWPGYKHLCKNVCTAVSAQLNNGISAGEAVTLAVQMLEDSEMTNAGYGSNLTESGSVECDASVMDTCQSQDPLNCCDSYFGAIAGVSKIKNPVSAAYRILCERRKTNRLELGRIPPSFLVSAGAENWAKAHGIDLCQSDDLISETAFKSWKKYHRRLLEKLARTRKDDCEMEMVSGERMDTVGAVALDLNGNVASAVSSGGIMLKMPGRVGQAAVYGCGCWAEPGKGSLPSIAVTSSGCGEQLVSTMLSKKCAENLRMHELPYQAVQDTLVKDFLGSCMLSSECDKQAGLLCLHHSVDGTQDIVEVVWGHTTSSMVVSHMSTTDKTPKVVLSRLPINAVPGKSLTVGGSWTKVSCSHVPDQHPCTANSEATMSRSKENMESDLSGNLDGVNDPQTSTDEHVVDPDISIMYVSESAMGIPLSDCKVVLSDEFNRKVDSKFEENITMRWEERVKQNPRLFNAQKFRIHSVHQSSEHGHSPLVFNLGLTCYRDYMETNWAKEVIELKSKGSKDYGQTQAYLAEPLGVAGVVLTNDGCAIFQWRNSWVAEGAGQLDVPGGHPEPSAAAGVEMRNFVTFADLDSENVLREIFHSQAKEVRDEVNVPIEKIDEPKLMGLVRNKLSGGRPVAYFLMKCHMTTEEILNCYRRGGPETDESTNLRFIPETDIANLKSVQPDLWGRMCPNGKAACTLYGILQNRS